MRWAPDSVVQLGWWLVVSCDGAVMLLRCLAISLVEEDLGGLDLYAFNFNLAEDNATVLG